VVRQKNKFFAAVTGRFAMSKNEKKLRDLDRRGVKFSYDQRKPTLFRTFYPEKRHRVFGYPRSRDASLSRAETQRMKKEISRRPKIFLTIKNLPHIKMCGGNFSGTILYEALL